MNEKEQIFAKTMYEECLMLVAFSKSYMQLQTQIFQQTIKNKLNKMEYIKVREFP